MNAGIMNSENVQQYLYGLEKEMDLPFHSSPKVLTTIYNLVRKYSSFEPEEVFQAINDVIADGSVLRLFKGRKDGNLSICVYYAAKWRIGSQIASNRAQKRTADVVSLSATIGDETTVEDTLGHSDEIATNEAKQLMNKFYNTLSEKDKVLYIMLLEDHSVTKISEVLGCSPTYASRRIKAFYEVAKKRITNMTK